MAAPRTIERMVRMDADKAPLRHICLAAAEQLDPVSALENELKRFRLSSRREVHFCRGFLDAILCERVGG